MCCPCAATGATAATNSAKPTVRQRLLTTLLPPVRVPNGLLPNQSERAIRPSWLFPVAGAKCWRPRSCPMRVEFGGNRLEFNIDK